MKKLLWLDEEVSVVCSISDPDDKIATNPGGKSTTYNRIATGVISGTNPDLFSFSAVIRHCKSLISH